MPDHRRTNGAADDPGPERVRIKVLIVDDDPVAVQQLAVELNALGLNTVVANDPKTAREMAENSELRIAIVSDRVGAGAGYQFIADMRHRDPVFCSIAITDTAEALHTTALTDALRAGAVDFLTTPLQADDLSRAIDRCRAFLSGGPEPHSMNPSLAESKKRQQDFIEVSSDWFWEMDAELRFTFVSDNFYDRFDVSTDQWIGKTRHEMAGKTANRIDSEKWSRHFDDLENRRPFRDMAYSIPLPEGNSAEVVISGIPTFNSVGVFTGYRGSGTDITRQVRAQEALEQAHAELEARVKTRTNDLSAANRQLEREIDAREKSERRLRISEDRLKQAIESISDGFSLFDSDDRLVLVNSKMRELYPVIADLLIPGITYEEMLRESVARGGFKFDGDQKETWISNRVARHRLPEFSEIFEMSDGRSIRVEERRTPDGSVVGVRSDVTELLRGQMALRESEARTRVILDVSPVGISIVSLDGGKRLYVNRRMVEMFGATSAEQLLAHPIEDTYADSADRRQLRNQNASGELLEEVETRRRRLDGSEWWCLANRRRMAYGGQEAYVIWHYDISDRVATQTALRESETLFRQTFEQASVGMSLVDLDGIRLDVNQALAELIGQPREALIGTPMASSGGTAADTRKAETLRRRVIDGDDDVYRVERTYTRDDGTIVWVQASGTLIRNPDGSPRHFVFFMVDITDRKRTDEALQESERRFREAFEHAPTGMALITPDGSRFSVNQALADFLGFSIEELTDTDMQSTSASSEALNRSVELRQKVIDGEMASYTNERQYRHKDGQLLWGEVTASLVRDDDGEPLYFIAHTVDTTEQKRVTEELRESEARFRDFAAATSDWYWEMDEELRFSYFSDIQEELAEFVSDVLLGKTREETGLPGLSEEAFQSHLDDLKHHRPFRNFVHPRELPNGQVLYLSISGRPNFDAGGRFLGYRGTGINVTDRMLADQKARETEQRFQMLAAASPAGVFYADTDGVCQFVNQAFCELTGIPADQAIGTSWDTTLSVDDADRAGEAWTQAVVSNTAFETEVRFENASGRFVWAQISASPHHSADGELRGYLGTAINIEERKSVERELREVEARATTILNNAPAAIYVKDTQGRYLQANDRFVEVFGPAANAVGMTDQQLFGPNIANILERNDRRLLRSGVPTEDEETIQLRGRSRTLLTARFPLYNISGEPYAVCGISTDITERKMTEAQLLHSSKMASIGSMSAGIAHELSQPLNIINLTVDDQIIGLDAGEYELPDVRTALDSVSQQCRRMAQTISHMSIFSRIDSSDHEPFDIGNTLKETVALLEKPFMAEGFSITMEIVDGGGFVIGQRSQLEQVIINLLTNARDAMRESNADEHHEIRQIALTCVRHPSEPTIDIIVQDHGPGIPDDALAHIFDPFYTTKESGKGTGLGLAISMEIINAMAGMISAKNTPDGACFTINLPLGDAPQDMVFDEPWAVRNTSAAVPADETRRILVVDDEVSAANSLARHLKRKGFVVDTANDGVEAFSQFNENPADLVVTDLRMPRLNGEGLIKKLHAEDSSLPVVVVTGDLDAGQIMKIPTGDGAIELLHKPIDLRVLDQTIEILLTDAGNSP